MSYYTSDLYRDVEAYYKAREAEQRPDTLDLLEAMFEKYGHAEVHSACRTYQALRKR